MPRHHPPPDDEPRQRLSRDSLWGVVRLAGYLWPYRLRWAVAMSALFLGGATWLVLPYLCGRLLDAALAGRAEVDAIALALAGVLAAQAALAFLRVVFFTSAGERGLADLRRDVYANLIRLPMHFHAGRRVGELTSRLSADLERLHSALIDSVPEFVRQSVLLVGGVALIATTSLKLTGLMLASVPVLMVVAVSFGGLIRRLSKRAQDRLAASNVVVEETLQNVASVKAFTNEPFELGRYRAALADYVAVVLRAAVFEGAFVSFIVFALFGAGVLVLWYGSRLVLARELEAGQLFSFLLYTTYVAGAAGSFAHLYASLQRTAGASQRVRELLREVPEAEGGEAVARPGGEVEFRGVRFRYPSRPEAEVLRGVSLVARPGQRVALVGPSGAGKSTLVSLLLRLYDPQAGQILLDGRDLRGLDLRQLRSRMAVVPQEVILFGGTIAENVAYGKPGATPAEVEAAARAANAHDFISAFPEGYATRVGERGVQLSGGQRQRIAIARAILRDPAVLLLDEATSSLDSNSESEVLQALDRLMRGRTSFVVAHRLSTVRDADVIFVLDQGEVVEAGTHAELMDRPEGLYRGLSLLQAQPELDASAKA